MIAFVLAFVMVLEMAPLSLLAAPDSSPPVDSPSSSISAEYDGIIVRMKETPGMMAAQSLEVPGAHIVVSDGPVKLLETQEGASEVEVLKALRQNPLVEYAEPNYLIKAQMEPIDPLFQTYQWGVKEMEGPSAWDKATAILNAKQAQASEVKVAVIDTGIDAAHPDLDDRIVEVAPEIDLNLTTPDDVDDPVDDSWSGHGTHVAGIIAAETNNKGQDDQGIGIAGMGGEFPVKIIPIKVLDEAGVGTMFNVARAIDLAKDLGARVINLSLGGRAADFPLTLAQAVVEAQNAGILIVAAAGNEGDSAEGFYPACLPGVIPVRATNQSHQVESYSNYLSGDVNAPGAGIHSTLPADPDNPGVPQYGSLSGTSQAAAFVSGTAALAWSVLPDLAPVDLARYIATGETGRWTSHGTYYVLSAKRVLDLAEQGVEDSYGDVLFVIPEPYSQPRLVETVPLMVKVSGPETIDRVEFTFAPSDDWNDERPIGTVHKEDFTEGGYASVEWDTTQWDGAPLPDGDYVVSAYLYDVDDEYCGGDDLSVTVANGQDTGLIISVLDPVSGEAASGAWVTVHHAYWDEYEGFTLEKVWNGPADLAGKLRIPNSQATGGNEYLITARGSEPNFFYYKVVKAPNANVVLDDSDAQLFEISAQKTDGTPLATATVFLEMLEANLPMADGSDYPVVFDLSTTDSNRIAMVELDAGGTGTISLTRGRYNLKVLSPVDRYYLYQRDVRITEDTEEVLFHPSLAEVTTLRFLKGANCITATLLLSVAGDPYMYGFDRLLPDDLVTVSRGAYEADISSAVFHELSSAYWYSFSFERQFTLDDDDATLDLQAGGQITAELTEAYEDQEYRIGRSSYFGMDFKDSYGNKVTGLSTDTQWPFASIDGQSAESGTESRVMVRKAGQAEGGEQLFALDPGSGCLEPVRQVKRTSTRILR
jgi:thermitase